MIRGEYKNILWQIFEVLGLFENEKEKALEGFKKKFANELLIELRSSLSAEQNQWITETAVKKEYDKGDPKITEIQKTIDSAYSKEEFDKISHSVFKKILTSYVNFMSQKVSSEKVEKLKKIGEAF